MIIRESRSSLAGRTALVTGGSRGVGAATSKLLAARGANDC
jgi:3-oxoacyl-[acyl-carrier protein] reductase